MSTVEALVQQGSSALLDATLNLVNDQTVAADPTSGTIAQDNLSGDFDLPVSGLFDFSGFLSFVDLAAGDALTDLLVSFDAVGLGVGTYSAVVELDASSVYAGLSPQALDPFRLVVTARVAGVPLPGAAWLMVLPLGWMLWSNRRAPQARG